MWSALACGGSFTALTPTARRAQDMDESNEGLLKQLGIEGGGTWRILEGDVLGRQFWQGTSSPLPAYARLRRVRRGDNVQRAEQ